MQEMVLFGTGEKGKKLSALFNHYGVRVKYWIDSDCIKWGQILDGKKIYAPSRLQDEEDVWVCISATDENSEMNRTVLNYGVPEDHILTFGRAVVNCIYDHYRWSNQIDFSDETNIILDCSKGLGLGGVEAWSIGLLKELKRDRDEVYLFSPYGNYEVENEWKEHVLWVDSDSQNLFCYKNIENMIAVLQKKLPCILISSFPGDLLLAACCLKRKYPKQVRILSVIHQGTAAVCKEYLELSPHIEKYIAVSKDIQEGMERRGIETSRIYHMTCPVDCIEPYTRTYSLDKKKKLKIGYAGRIEAAQKRLDQLFVLIKELEKLHTNYQMEIAGDGSYLNKLEEKIKASEWRHKITLLGKMNREEIASFWSKQDVCINLSDFEGRSISIMEAMKNGAVPVVTATSGVKEDITSGINGYIVDIGNYKDMAEKIDYLEKNRQLLSLLGVKAHEVMEQKSSMDVHISFWNKIIIESECG